MRKASRPVLSFGVLLYVVSAALHGLSYAGGQSPVQARALATKLDKVTHVNAIPAPVLKALSPLHGGKKLVDSVYLDKATNMWKPNAADRLLFAGKSPTLWLVHYEQHDPTPTHHLAIIELKGNDRAVVLEHLLMNEEADSLAALKNMIERGQFKTVAGVESTTGVH